MMKIIGLVATKVVRVKEVRAVDLVVSYQMYSLGDGEVAVEAKTSYDQSIWGPSIKEWVGFNGTRDEEEATNFNEIISRWEKDPQGGMKVVKKGYSYQEYMAPDGELGSYKHFIREINRGKLHGLLLSF